MPSKKAQINITPVVGRLVVIGIGLIGGSLAAALKKRGACKEVIGIARSVATCKQAVTLGVVDRAYTSLNKVAQELTSGDVIFIAVPTLSVKTVLESVKTHISSEVTVTDGASVKGSVKLAAQEVFGGRVPPQFVLGHPIAGSEKSGVTAFNPDLYENHRCILTPLPSTGGFHLDLVTRMWQAAGAEVLKMTVASHDKVLGATSHLPHVIAYSLVDTLGKNSNIFRYAAGGFRDFTRIASSDPLMWHDIMRANKTDVLDALNKFIKNLEGLRESIESENSQHMLKVFKNAKSTRDKLVHTLDHRTTSAGISQIAEQNGFNAKLKNTKNRKASSHVLTGHSEVASSSSEKKARANKAVKVKSSLIKKSDKKR